MTDSVLMEIVQIFQNDNQNGITIKMKILNQLLKIIVDCLTYL